MLTLNGANVLPASMTALAGVEAADVGGTACITTVQQHERLKVTLTKLNLKLTTTCPLDD